MLVCDFSTRRSPAGHINLLILSPWFYVLLHSHFTNIYIKVFGSISTNIGCAPSIGLTVAMKLGVVITSSPAVTPAARGPRELPLYHYLQLWHILYHNIWQNPFADELLRPALNCQIKVLC